MLVGRYGNFNTGVRYSNYTTLTVYQYTVTTASLQKTAVAELKIIR